MAFLVVLIVLMHVQCSFFGSMSHKTLFIILFSICGAFVKLSSGQENQFKNLLGHHNLKACGNLGQHEKHCCSYSLSSNLTTCPEARKLFGICDRWALLIGFNRLHLCIRYPVKSVVEICQPSLYQWCAHIGDRNGFDTQSHSSVQKTGLWLIHTVKTWACKRIKKHKRIWLCYLVHVFIF